MTWDVRWPRGVQAAVCAGLRGCYAIFLTAAALATIQWELKRIAKNWRSGGSCFFSRGNFFICSWANRVRLNQRSFFSLPSQPHTVPFRSRSRRSSYSLTSRSAPLKSFRRGNPVNRAEDERRKLPTRICTAHRIIAE